MITNKIILYVCLIFLYLGLSKSLSPSELGISYVNSTESLASIIKGLPLTVILIDTHETGFIIKTFYHKYRIVYGLQTYQELIVRVSRNYMSKHSQNIGLSILRRDENNTLSFGAIPPGIIFVNNSSFGSWKYNREQNTYLWKFYRAYRYLPRFLGITGFNITKAFYQESIKSLSSNKKFIGFNDEFGIEGSVTQAAFPNYFQKKGNDDIEFKKYIKNYFKRNFYKK